MNKSQNLFIYSFFKTNIIKMATIKNKKMGKQIQIKDGSKIKESCEKLGVPFGCEDGRCGTCMIKISEGENNLSELNEKENDLGRDKNNRLACSIL